MKLGDILVRHSFITPAQLGEGLVTQVTHGGRIGSNLIDLGFVAVDNIARALGQQHKVPAASDDAFRAVPSEALGVLPRDVCAQHGVCPLGVEGPILHLAMRDPQHLALIDQIERQVGLTVRAYATPELRLLYFLELLYRIPRPKRYQSAEHAAAPAEAKGSSRSREPSGGIQRTPSGLYAMQGNAAREPDPINPPSRGTGPYPAQRSPTGPFSNVGGATSPQRGPLRKVPTAPKRVPATTPQATPVVAAPPAAAGGAGELELVYLDEVARQPAPRPSAPQQAAPLAAPTDNDGFDDDGFDIDIDIDIDIDDAANVAPPESELDQLASLGEVIERLGQAEDRETVISLLLRPSLSRTSLDVLLLPRGDLAVGLAAFGTEVPRAQVRQLVVPLNTDSLFKQAVAEKRVFRGPADALQHMVANYLRAPTPAEVCVVPVALSDKVINLICCQTATTLSDSAVSDLTQIANAAAAAYGRLILKKRSPR